MQHNRQIKLLSLAFMIYDEIRAQTIGNLCEHTLTIHQESATILRVVHYPEKWEFSCAYLSILMCATKLGNRSMSLHQTNSISISALFLCLSSFDELNGRFDRGCCLTKNLYLDNRFDKVSGFDKVLFAQIDWTICLSTSQPVSKSTTYEFTSSKVLTT